MYRDRVFDGPGVERDGTSERAAIKVRGSKLLE